jgi:hypothetical protein
MTMQKAVQLSGAELRKNDVFSAPYISETKKYKNILK